MEPRGQTVTITDAWVDEQNTNGFLELWNWCVDGETADRCLRCMVPRWTVKIEHLLDEFHLQMAQRVHSTNYRGLAHFRLDIGCLDGAVGFPKRFEYTAVWAWRWFMSEQTTIHLHFHCKRYHQPGVEFGWANAIVKVFTKVECRETRIVVVLCGSTVKDIKGIVGVYLNTVRDSESNDLHRMSLKVCHDIGDGQPDVLRQLETIVCNEAAYVLRGRHPIPNSLVSIVFDDRIQCAS